MVAAPRLDLAAFAFGSRQFQTVFASTFSVDVLEEVNRVMDEQADCFLETLPVPPPAEEGSILIATADSKTLPLVRKDVAQVPAFEHKERPGNRRTVTLGCVYTVDPYVRTPEQIVAALFRKENGFGQIVAKPAIHPEACHEHYPVYYSVAARDSESAGKDAFPGAYRA